ncbi:MAG: hypothetical protein KIS92_26355, partial [Planctomycetota bacterium]|nr:hypothetical protein [Planctomycetota bacterium]
ALVLVAALGGYAAHDARVLAGGAPERTVASTFVLDAPREAVWQASSFDRRPGSAAPWWLGPLPAPERYAFGAQSAGAERWVDYGPPVRGDDADRPRGKIVYRIACWDDGRGATFVCVRNETRLGRWVDLIETRLDLEDLPPESAAAPAASTLERSAGAQASPRTKVTLTTRYRRRLGPDVYFNPLMDGAVDAMHAMLADELREGSR